jgi:hypothetical protein
MSVSHKPTLIAIFAVLGYQLLLPPIVGLADQGDYARLLGPFHLGPTVKAFEQRYYGFLNRTYTRDPTFRTPGWEGFTSQYLFVGCAVALNRLISKDGLLDIRVLGVIHIAAFLGASYWLLGATRRLPHHYLISLALIFIFCDVGYVSYFNSFFSEPASYLFLLLLLAVWLEIISGEANRLALFTVCGVLFITAKPQNCIAGILLAGYVLRFRWIVKKRLPAPVCSVVLACASVAMYLEAPKMLRRAAVYNMVFMTIVPGSPDPAEELRSFGLDPGLAKYAGTAAFSPNTMFWYPEFQEQLAKRVNHFRILLYYLQRPARFLRLVQGVLPRSTSLRAEYSGNFEQASGYPPMFRSKAFSLWSDFREHWFSRYASIPFLLLIVSVPVALWVAVRARNIRKRLLAECYCMLALLALVSFFTTILGDAHDTVKHLFVYNVLTDICATFAVVVAVASAARAAP